MIARAFEVGTETSPAWEEAVPMGVIELGTSASQPSSCCESTGPLSVYQEPAWVALRVTISTSLERRDSLNVYGKLKLVRVRDSVVLWYRGGVREAVVGHGLWKSCIRHRTVSLFTASTTFDQKYGSASSKADHNIFRSEAYWDTFCRGLALEDSRI